MWNQIELEYLFDDVENDGYKIKIYNNKISKGSVLQNLKIYLYYTKTFFKKVEKKREV